MKSSSPSNLKNFLDQWGNLINSAGVIIALMGLFLVAIQTRASVDQANLVATQIANELVRPILQGNASYTQGFREGLEEIESEMVNHLFTEVIELSANSPEMSYSQLVETTAPITRSIPPAPVIVSVSVTNQGDSTATNVSISINWKGEITSIDVNALSHWEVSDGGQGHNNAVILIERIAQEEIVEVSVEYAPTKDTTDILELSIEHPDALFPFFGGKSPIPTFAVIPGEFTPSYDEIAIKMASDNTPVQQLPVESAMKFFK